MTTFDAWLDQMTAEVAGQIAPDRSYCSTCDNGGWEGYFGPQGSGPNFRVCPDCGNPNDEPEP